MDRSGKEIRGQIEASTEEVVIDRLRGMGYFPTEVKKSKDTVGHVALEDLPGIKQVMKVLTRGKVGLKHMMPFTRQLAVLISAGLPLLRSIRILSEQSESANLKEALVGIAGRLNRATPCLVAKFPTFDRLFVNMIRAGEIGGPKPCSTVSLFRGEIRECQRKIKTRCGTRLRFRHAGGLLVLSRMDRPCLRCQYEELGAERRHDSLLIAMSELVTKRYWAIAISLGFVVFMWKFLRRYDWGLFATDSFLLRMPIFGKIVQKACLARFARTFATLLEAGVPSFGLSAL
jgi:type IV pilus assembly protein PilC